MRHQKGFTLIEMLVVVFIIGVLAAGVLASISSSKARGSDTGVKAEIGTIATQATLYYGIANQYQDAGVTNYNGGTATCGVNATGNTVFYDSTNIDLDQPIKNAIIQLEKDVKSGSSPVCRSKTDSYLVMGQLSNGNWYCADSTASTTFGGPVEVTAKPSGLTCQ